MYSIFWNSVIDPGYQCHHYFHFNSRSLFRLCKSLSWVLLLGTNGKECWNFVQGHSFHIYECICHLYSHLFNIISTLVFGGKTGTQFLITILDWDVIGNVEMIRSSISSHLIPYPTRSIFCPSCIFDEAWNNSIFESSSDPYIFMDWYNSSIWSKLSLDSELERWCEIRWKQSLYWCHHMLMRDQHSREYNFLFNKYKISWNCLMLIMPSLHPSWELKPNWFVRSCNSWNNKSVLLVKYSLLHFTIVEP